MRILIVALLARQAGAQVLRAWGQAQPDALCANSPSPIAGDVTPAAATCACVSVDVAAAPPVAELGIGWAAPLAAGSPSMAPTLAALPAVRALGAAYGGSPIAYIAPADESGLSLSACVRMPAGPGQILVSIPRPDGGWTEPTTLQLLRAVPCGGSTCVLARPLLAPSADVAVAFEASDPEYLPFVGGYVFPSSQEIAADDAIVAAGFTYRKVASTAAWTMRTQAVPPSVLQVALQLGTPTVVTLQQYASAVLGKCEPRWGPNTTFPVPVLADAPNSTMHGSVVTSSIIEFTAAVLEVRVFFKFSSFIYFYKSSISGPCAVPRAVDGGGLLRAHEPAGRGDGFARSHLSVHKHKFWVQKLRQPTRCGASGSNSALLGEVGQPP